MNIMENSLLQDRTTNTTPKGPRTPKRGKQAKVQKNHARQLIGKLHSCGKSGNPIQAEKHLQKMKSLFDKGNKEMRPDIRHYNSLMHAWVKSNLPNKAMRAHEILISVIDMLKADAVKNAHLKPSNVSFNICINAWSKCRDNRSSEYAWNLFEYMMQLYSADLTSSGPDYHTFRSVLQALSKNVEKGTAQKAERVLSVMKAETDPAVKPDDTIYHVIMHIYSHNREMNAPQRAEKLLEEMHLRNHEGDESLKPSVITFNTLLNTYAKSFMEGAADRAEEVLDHMQMLHENGVKGVEPDCISFNTVLNCHASSGAKGSDRRAFGILTRMHELYATGRISVEPNARTYNACIKACLCSSISGTTEELDESMSLACKILSMVQYDALTSARADEYTYHWFFKVCKALCNDDQKRFTMVQWGFNFCQENGLVTSRIMDQVRDLVDSNLLVPYSVLPAKRGQTYSSPRSITTSLYSEPPRSPSSSGPEPRLLDFSATTSPVQPTSQSERSIWGSIDANNAQNCISSHTTVAKTFVFPPSTVPTSPPCNIATDSASSMNDTFEDSQLHSRLISLCSSGDEF